MARRIEFQTVFIEDERGARQLNDDEWVNVRRCPDCGELIPLEADVHDGCDG